MKRFLAFMLSDFDSEHGGYSWVRFEKDRFYVTAKKE